MVGTLKISDTYLERVIYEKGCEEMTAIELKKKRKRNKRRAIAKLILAIVVLCICFLIIGAAGKNNRKVIGYEYESTDTLWGLLEHCPYDMNRWDFIDLVMELNGMTSCTVQANRLYQVPVFE